MDGGREENDHVFDDGFGTADTLSLAKDLSQHVKNS